MRILLELLYVSPVNKERLLIIDRRRFRCTVVLDPSRSHRLLILAILRALRELKLLTHFCADDQLRVGRSLRRLEATLRSPILYDDPDFR